jgi:hypothetical protein
MANYHIEPNQIITIIGPGKVDVVSDEEPVVTTVEAPTIGSLEPDEAVAGAPDDIELIVTGTGFNELTKIVFNGYAEPTKFLSDTQVSTGVKPSLFVVPATCPVAVRTGAMVSDTLDFDFTDPAADDEVVTSRRTTRRSKHKRK